MECHSLSGRSTHTKDALRAGLFEGQTHEYQRRNGHHGADGKIPIASAARYMIVGSDRVGHAIDLKCLVTHVGVSKAAYCDNALRLRQPSNVAPGLLDLVEYEFSSGSTSARYFFIGNKGTV